MEIAFNIEEQEKEEFEFVQTLDGQVHLLFDNHFVALTDKSKFGQKSPALRGQVYKKLYNTNWINKSLNIFPVEDVLRFITSNIQQNKPNFLASCNINGLNGLMLRYYIYFPSINRLLKLNHDLELVSRGEFLDYYDDLVHKSKGYFYYCTDTIDLTFSAIASREEFTVK